jgi:hypothetical protein
VSSQPQIAVLGMRTTQAPFHVAASADPRGVNDGGMDAEGTIRRPFAAKGKFGVPENRCEPAGRPFRGSVAALMYVNGGAVD